MKRKIVAFAMLPYAAFAAATVHFDASEAAYADGEASTVAAFPRLAAVPSHCTVEIEGADSVGEFEVWFCTDESASPASCDFVIGVDAGRLFARGRDLHTIEFCGDTLPENAVSIVFRFKQNFVGETIPVVAETNGTRNGFLSAQFAEAHPGRWCSMKIVSRDCASGVPAVSVSRSGTGTAIRLAALH